MSAERTALRMMLIVSALAGAAWLAMRAAQLAVGSQGATIAGGHRALIVLCGVAAVALCAFAAATFVALRRALHPPPSRSSAPGR